MSGLEPKLIVGARRRPGMTHAEFIDYIVNIHGELAKAGPPGVKRYVQNHVYDGAFGSDVSRKYVGMFHRDSVTELFFSSLDDMARNFSSEYVRTVVAPDGAKFSEEGTEEIMLTRETVLMPPPASSAGTKIMHFLFPATTADAAQAAWHQAHEQAVAQQPEFARALTGLIRSDALPAQGGATQSHFSGNDAPKAALVSSLWLPDAAVPLFRPYETAILESGMFDRQQSHFLFTRECEILREN